MGFKIKDDKTERFQYRGYTVEIKWLAGESVYDCPALELYSYKKERAIVQAIGRKLGKKGRRCEFCGMQNVELVAVLKADPDQKVCKACAADERIPTLAMGAMQ